jgi:hypothetical protein
MLDTCPIDTIKFDGMTIDRTYFLPALEFVHLCGLSLRQLLVHALQPLAQVSVWDRR